MVNCSSLRKNVCSVEAKCKWETGRGCRSANTKESINEQMSAKKKESINKPMKNQVIVFSGFRDADLVIEIQLNGGRVTQNVSGATTIVVAKDITKVTIAVRHAKEKGIKLYSIDDFVSTFDINTQTMASVNMAIVQKARVLRTSQEVPEGFVGSSLSSLPVHPNKSEETDLYYEKKEIHYLYQQAQTRVKKALDERYELTVITFANFLGYDKKRDFLLILQIKSELYNSPGAYDIIVAFISYNPTGGFWFNDYRPLIEGVPKGKTYDIDNLLNIYYELHEKPFIIFTDHKKF